MTSNSSAPRRGRHPVLFGILLVLLAMALIFGAMAFFRSQAGSGFFGGVASPKLGLVRLEGMIVDSEAVNGFIKTLEDDPAIRGVIVRINSPGGVVAPSQEMFHAVKRLAGKKPVVVSMSTVAASGGYYVACGGDTIFANPGTLTASIGVKAEYPNFRGLMDKLGVSYTLLATGRMKGVPNSYEELTPEQRQYLLELLMDVHRQFVADVASARNLDLVKVEAIADGRAMTGSQALAAGLVDRLGGMDDAVAFLKARLDIVGPVEFVEGPEKKYGFLREILSEMGLDLQGSAGRRLSVTLE